MQLFREAVSLTTSIPLEFAQAGIVAWAGQSKTPYCDVHFPFWSSKACDGLEGRLKLTLMCSTMAAQVEFTGLHAAAMSLLNACEPTCSHFDLSRWGLLEVALAIAGSVSANRADEEEASSPANAARSRSRSPPPLTHYSTTDGAPKGAKGGGRGGRNNHGRSGLEPMVIELIRAWYNKNWDKCGQLCDQIWHLRPNIQKRLPMWK